MRKFIFIALSSMLFLSSSAQQQNVWQPVGADTGRVSKLQDGPCYGGVYTDMLGTPYVLYGHPNTEFSIRKFDGTNWVSVGYDDYAGSKVSITFSPQNVPYICYFTTDIHHCRVIKFDGTDWQQVGPLIPCSQAIGTTSIAVDANDSIYVSFGNIAFTSGLPLPDTFGEVLSYNGSSWNHVGDQTKIKKGNFNRLAIDRSTNKLYLRYESQYVYTPESTTLQFHQHSWNKVGENQKHCYDFEAAPTGGIYSLHILSPSNLLYVDVLKHGYWDSLPQPNGAGGGNLEFNQDGTPYLFYGDPLTVISYKNKTWTPLGMLDLSPFNVSRYNGAVGNGIPYVAFISENNYQVYVWKLAPPPLSVYTVESLPPNLEISPNPATSTVTLQTTQSGTLQITDMLGRILLSQPLAQSKTSLSIAHLPAGVYTYRFTAKGGGTANGKLIISP